MKKKQIFIAGFIIAVLAFATLAFSAMFVNARVVFSGMKIIINENSKDTQTFINISLRNVETPGFAFCLKYDKNYLTLSNAETNEAINPSDASSGYDYEHEYFKQNYDSFPEDCFMNIPPEVSEHLIEDAKYPVLGSADVENGYISMNFVPLEDAAEVEGSAIGVNSDGETVIQANTAKGELLGSLSFKVNDPPALSKLSQEELNKIIQIIPFSSMGITYEGDDTGVDVGYLDENGELQFYTRADKYIDYEISLEVELNSVTADVASAEVNAYDIYRDGKIDDLVHYLNTHMSNVTLEYTDGKRVPSTIVWDTSADGFQCDEEWNPKGNNICYKIQQNYNDNNKLIPVKVEVTVTPVTLTGYSVGTPYKSYVKDAEDFPKELEEIDPPHKATPILEPSIINVGLGDVSVVDYELKNENGEATGETLNDLPDDFKNGEVGEYGFIAHVDYTNADWDTTAPWLTYDPTVYAEFTRYIVDSEDDLPKPLIIDESYVDDDGAMHITVHYDGGKQMSEDTEFEICLPGGEKIDTSSVSTAITIDDDGKATIVISPDITKGGYQKFLAETFNLGSRLGDFSISAGEKDEPHGEFKKFSVTDRTNSYLETTYTFDYSNTAAAMFNIGLGQLPSTTVTLNGDAGISTTYSGYDGSEPGSLKTFKVDEWSVESGDKNTAGSVVTVKGRLSDTTYSNYGKVSNTKNSAVVIKYIVGETELTDETNEIEDFTFNKQQLGYGYDKLQTKTFTLTNTGTTKIEGLTVDIAYDNDGAGIESFLLSELPATTLASGAGTSFDITTKHGLPIGVHTAKVTVTSNRNVLTTFNVTFEVTEKAVHNITVMSNNDDWGEAKATKEVYTAMEGEAIEIEATPVEDCEFVKWLCDIEGVTIDSETSSTTSFVMPDTDVIITAEFKESLAAYLRFTSLQVRNTYDDKDEEITENNVNSLYDKDWKQTEFSPTVREYNVYVPNNVAKDDIWFTIREEGAGATVTVTKDGTEITSAPDEENNTYKTEDFALAVSPEVNTVKIDLDYTLNEESANKSYIIHIYRKIESTKLVTFSYGNSPYGMIMNTFAEDNDKAKAAKEAFKGNKYRFAEGYVPDNGNTSTRYRPEAWSNGQNYDLDDYAVFVINTDKFVDRGWESVQNSIGASVNPKDIQRSITVNVLAETNPDFFDGSEDDFADIEQTKIDIPDSETIQCEITQLKDLRIRPDVYKLKYTFKDFDGQEIVREKPVIILSPSGDLNVDNEINNKDSNNIFHRFKTKIPDSLTYDYNTGGKLYRYRVCDTNQDGNINAIDANVITAKKTISFYTNMEGGD